MIKHSEILHTNKWDVLVILDACRYDTFKKIYREYIPHSMIKTKLCKANSEAYQTLNWLHNHWSNFYDILYVSGNPYVNSRDVNIGKYKGNQHFVKIWDSWDWCYNKKNSRIEPDCITADAMHWKSSTHSDKQMIVHYMQPHSPYLFKDKHFKWYEMFRNHISLKYLPKRLRNYLIKNYKREDVYANLECGNGVIVKAYEDNLRSVLPSVIELVEGNKGKRFLVTSDHGEYLGEGGKFGHDYGLDDFISNVPLIILRSD